MYYIPLPAVIRSTVDFSKMMAIHFEFLKGDSSDWSFEPLVKKRIYYIPILIPYSVDFRVDIVSETLLIVFEFLRSSSIMKELVWTKPISWMSRTACHSKPLKGISIGL
jgi:hypothetical protein